MTHSTAVLFAQVGDWLLASTKEAVASETPLNEPKSPAPVRLDPGRDRLPPRDESLYWAWQYWSQ